MELRSIGSLKVGAVGLGCNNFGGRLDEEATRAVVHASLDAGITLFDTADVYGGGKSEEFLGRALAARRDDVVVATKFGMGAENAGRRDYVLRACEESLRRLGTDRIDLYQFHRPDPNTPVEETLGALDELVRAGKVVAIGNSNFSGEQVETAESTSREKAWTRFVCAQNHYSLLHRDAETHVLPACAELGLGFLPYFPLASGMLTGKYRRDAEPPAGSRLAGIPAERRDRWMSDHAFDVVESLESFAAARNRTIGELAIAWLLANPVVASVIAGATSPEQVRANVAAASWSLTGGEVEEVSQLAR
jgi:aryl-alcohol dehydrogenase-like predicted oxidoreductase